MVISTFNSLYGILFQSKNLLPLISFFQFPLWDTKQSCYFVFYMLFLTFNSLYGILNEIFKIKNKNIPKLSIPFMGYIVSIANSARVQSKLSIPFMGYTIRNLQIINNIINSLSIPFMGYSRAKLKFPFWNNY